MSNFLHFLESIKTQSNKILIESLSSGYVLIESPDTVVLPNTVNSITWENSDAIPFIYSDKIDKFFLDKEVTGGMHSDLINRVINQLDEFDGKNSDDLKVELGFKDASRYNAGIRGRIWTRYKIIALWDYPSTEVFKNKIIDGLKNSGINIDNNWKVEVFNKDGGTSLIPVNEYSGKFAPDKESQEELDRMREWHTLDPIEKEKRKKLNKAPANQSPTQGSDSNDSRSMAELNYLRKELVGD
jgi:hypothetical protein